jgi:uncharacterized protein
VIDQFARNLEARLLQDMPATDDVTAPALASDAASTSEEGDAALDVMAVVIRPALEQVAPYFACAAVGALVGYLIGRRRRPRTEQA